VLERSLDSLSFFEANHRGRVGQGAQAGDAPAAVPEDDEEAASPDAAAAAAARKPGALPRDRVTGASDVIDDADALLRESASALRDGTPSDDEDDDDGGGGGAAPGRRGGPGGRPLAMSGSLAGVSLVDVPVLPTGTRLTVTVRSTWGDPHYVGLAGVDVFDQSGARVAPPSEDAGPVRSVAGSRVTYTFGAADASACRVRSVSADPGDVNVLDGYGSDPRTADKLVDGTGFTRDDLHSWLAPWTPGSTATVEVELSRPCSVSMLRLWNYNKSRVHSYRGVRGVRLALDGVVVFDGEVRKAPGDLAEASQCAECVLFTTDQAVMDRLFGADPDGGEDDWTAEAMREDAVRMLASRRPDTADADAPARGTRAASAGLRRRRRGPQPKTGYEEAVREAGDGGEAAADGAASEAPAPRPRTGATADARAALASAPSGLTGGMPDGARPAGPSRAVSARQPDAHQAAPTPPAVCAPGKWSPWDVSPCAEGCTVDVRGLPCARVLELGLLETHGDPYYAGLTALRVLVADEATGLVRRVALRHDMLDASPRDINVVSDGGTLPGDRLPPLVPPPRRHPFTLAPPLPRERRTATPGTLAPWTSSWTATR